MESTGRRIDESAKERNEKEKKSNKQHLLEEGRCPLVMEYIVE